MKVSCKEEQLEERTAKRTKSVFVSKSKAVNLCIDDFYHPI